MYNLIGILMLVAIPVIFHKLTREKEEEETHSTEVLYTQNLHDSIQRLAAIDAELQAVDDLISNIEHGCDTDVLHSITIKWKWHSEQNPNSLDFPCYMQSKSALLQLAYSRRRELLYHLSSELKNIPLCHRHNMDKTIDNIIKENPRNGVGEWFEDEKRK